MVHIFSPTIEEMNVRDRPLHLLGPLWTGGIDPRNPS